MPYTRIWVHCVWGTKNRQSFLTEENTRIILDHIKENAREKSIYIDFINGCREHIHCIISLNQNQMMSAVMQLIKGESSYWINKNKVTASKFEWADEYFSVSIGQSQLNRVREYIKNQQEHHRRKTWAEEYNEFIRKYGFSEMKG